MSVALAARDRITGLLAEGIYDNPVIIREFRTRMRGLKAFMVMGGYVLFLSAVSFIGYIVTWNEYAGQGQAMSLVNRNIGMQLFMWLSWTQGILLSLIIPSLTSGSVTQELEHKTIEMLALTRMTPGKIALGKQLSGMLYSMVLLVSSLPIAAMCLMFGGISPAEIALSYVVLAAWCFLLTTIGVFWSSLFNRTASAALFAYGHTALYFLLTLMLGMIFLESYQARPHALSAMNPAVAPYCVMMRADVCGMKVPVALAAVIMHVAMGLLFLMVATTHIRFLRATRALPVKLLAIGISAFALWLFAGDTYATGFATARGYAADLMLGYAISVLIFVSLHATVFATGEPKAPEDRSLGYYALSFTKAFSGDLGGGIAFMMLWSAVLCAVLGGTLFWASKAGHFAVKVSDWTGWWHAAVAIVAIVGGLSAIGVLASALTTLRRNAAALVLLIAIVLFAGYGIVMAYYVDGVSDTSGPVWQLAALWPFHPLVASLGEWKHMPKLWWTPEDAWIVCSIAYLGVGAAALAFATGARRRCGGVKED